MHHLKALVILLLSLLSAKASSQDIEWLVLRDTSAILSLEDIIQNPPKERAIESILNYGFTKDVIWVSTEFKLSEPITIIVDNPLIRFVDFYLVTDSSILNHKAIEYQKNLETNEIEHSVITFNVPDQFTGRLIMRFQGQEPMIIPLVVLKTGELTTYISDKQIFGYLIIGGITVLVFLYLIFFISLGDRVYFLYWLYALTVMITVLRINGLLYKWVDFVTIFNDNPSIFETLPSITAGVFTIHFLQLKSHYRNMYNVITVMVALQFLSLIISFLGFNQFAHIFTDLIAFTFIPLAIVLGYKMWVYQKFNAAKYYLLSWIFVFVGAFIFFARNYGLLTSDSAIINHSIDLGITIEMMLLAVGLSKRIEQLRKEKERLHSENLKILEDQNEKLESLVQKRTGELASKNEELTEGNRVLEETVDALKATQKQLIHSEKMASLGVLSAGVGHEINNPLNYIKNGALGLIREVESQPKVSKTVRTYVDIIEKGVVRASDIVKSLGHFSRSGLKMDEECDVHDIIENCLVILHSKLKKKVDVIKHFHNKPIIIEGNEGKLHQAFLNILSNAEQAIEKKGEIMIKTSLNKEFVEIRISDTGNGIKEENLAKIHDPFFTTKPPGEGTGLGLSITNSIIEEHKGRIQVFSEVGEGSEFIIKLPKSV